MALSHKAVARNSGTGERPMALAVELRPSSCLLPWPVPAGDAARFACGVTSDRPEAQLDRAATDMR